MNQLIFRSFRFGILFVCILVMGFQASSQTQGKLLILGGGEIPSPMMNTILSMSGLMQGGYGVVLTVPGAGDSCHSKTLKQFPTRKVKMTCLEFASWDLNNQVKIDSLRQAKLIFIGGTDQARFMKVVGKTAVQEAIIFAYNSGAMIIGNSAGASLVGKWMITGTELKHKNNTGGCKSLESDNVEVSSGLGLVGNFIFEPHFLKKMRMNRLLTVAIEHPELICVGIDEGTALLIDGNKATVMGENQVVFISNPKKDKRDMNGNLGVMGINLSVYLSGDQVSF
ncbi:MAG: Type 1 glutamine amidotransferase-like domain-containing protein [Bacteroidetes bacterium]|nr:Type 1 glutamine amidotransferase-like domain-containing protein [Bacteroidota bacterium]